MHFDKLIEDVRALKASTDKLYIYGAGFYGKDIYKVLKRNCIEIDGFVLTDMPSKNTVLDVPVYRAVDVIDKHSGIVLGLSDIYMEDVIDYLRDIDIDFANIIDGGVYIKGVAGRIAIREKSMIEITTVIGCSINCRYCPQKVLLDRYFEKDKNRQKVMTLEDFKIYLKHTPEDCEFVFCGISEPFLNKDCMSMIKMAADEGRSISLFTTLVGLELKDMEELLQLPIRYVTLHVADKYNYAKIEKTEEYYKKIEKILNATKKNGQPFVDSVNTQMEADEKIAGLCVGKYEILTSLHDRAGNLDDDNLDKCSKFLKNEKIYCCSCGLDLDNQVLLPDGTLVLCNMDFGLQHQLGNLLQTEYDAIRDGQEMQRVMAGMAGDESVDILCRKCFLARCIKE